MPDGSLINAHTGSITKSKIARLPDQLTVKFGPSHTIGDFVLRVDRQVREAGVRLTLSEDFDDLLKLNQANLDSWYQLVPWINPEYGKLGPGQEFWLRGVDANGETVLAHAVRLFLCETSLREEVESLRMVYPDNARRADTNTYAVVTAPSASEIKGRISWSGGLWFRPDVRGKGFARLIPPLSRAIALTQWLPDVHVTYVTKEKALKGMTQTYGYDGFEDGIALYNMRGFPSPFELVVCAKRPDDVVAEMEEANARFRTMARLKHVEPAHPQLLN